MSSEIAPTQHSGCVLSNREIKSALERGEIRIDPPLQAGQIEEASINLRLGYKFTKLKDDLPFKIPLGKRGLWAIAESRLWIERTFAHNDEFGNREVYCLNPQKFLLGQTFEHIWMPRNLIARVEGRSSYARVGLSIHQTAPWLQPGWDGQITLEFFNCGPLQLELTPVDDMPCQISFFRLSSELPIEDAYGSSSTDAFQHQSTTLPKR